MNSTIAVIMQDFDLSDSFLESTHISVFSKDSTLWRVQQEYPVPKNAFTEPSALRDFVRQVIEEMGDCRILAGKELSGLAYHIFDRTGFHIFEIAEISDTCFDGILADVEVQNREQALRPESLCPIETAPGVYALDLIALQAACPEISSKKALKGFLEETPFFELSLICRHLPPWLSSSGFDIKTEAFPDGRLKAVILPKTCK